MMVFFPLICMTNWWSSSPAMLLPSLSISNLVKGRAELTLEQTGLHWLLVWANVGWHQIFLTVSDLISFRSFAMLSIEILERKEGKINWQPAGVTRTAIAVCTSSMHSQRVHLRVGMYSLTQSCSNSVWHLQHSYILCTTFAKSI